MSRSAQPERGSDWQAVQARGAHRVRARLSGPLPSSTMREELSMLHSTSWLSSCVNPSSWPKLTPQRRKVMEITGARICLRLSLSCSLRAARDPPMICKAVAGHCRRRAGRRRPRATRERPTVPPRAKSLWRSFPNRAIFRILHRHVSSGADGFNLLASRNQWRFPLISLW